MAIILTASYGGLQDVTRSLSDEMRIFKTTVRQTAYDNEYKRELCTHTLVRWDRQIRNNLKRGVPYQLIAQTEHKGSVKSIDEIEQERS